MPYFSATGTVVIEVSYCVEADSSMEAVEKAAAVHPLLDSRDLRPLSRELPGGLHIHPFHIEPINWLKANITQREPEQTQIKL